MKGAKNDFIATPLELTAAKKLRAYYYYFNPKIRKMAGLFVTRVTSQSLEYLKVH